MSSTFFTFCKKNLFYNSIFTEYPLVLRSYDVKLGYTVFLHSYHGFNRRAVPGSGVPLGFLLGICKAAVATVPRLFTFDSCPVSVILGCSSGVNGSACSLHLVCTSTPRRRLVECKPLGVIGVSPYGCRWPMVSKGLACVCCTDGARVRSSAMLALCRNVMPGALLASL